MPAFNAERFVARAIDSLVAQTFTDWERRFATTEKRDPEGSATRGSCSYNRGRRRNAAPDGRPLAFLDADESTFPITCTAEWRDLAEHPEHAGVFTDG